jgi:hypothetical protein
MGVSAGREGDAARGGTAIPACLAVHCRADDKPRKAKGTYGKRERRWNGQRHLAPYSIDGVPSIFDYGSKRLLPISEFTRARW